MKAVLGEYLGRVKRALSLIRECGAMGHVACFGNLPE